MSTLPLTSERCHNHATREAVAKCPDCRNFFCRECIAEHEEQVLCAACLKKRVGKPAATKRMRLPLWRTVQFGAAIFVLWASFFYLGRFLLSLSPAVHEGTLWAERWWDSMD